MKRRHSKRTISSPFSDYLIESDVTETHTIRLIELRPVILSTIKYAIIMSHFIKSMNICGPTV